MKDLLVEKVQNMVTNEDIIAVAVSGGEDSMALLRAVENADVNFFVVNVEHGIRGESSKRDSKFVEDYCKSKNIEFFGFSVNALEQNGQTLEENARTLRYNIFEDLVKTGKCNKVALAHHRRDQAETVLMRIIRGTGVTGLCGMRKTVGCYIRPFLDVDKNYIHEYVEKNNIPYVIDETNFENNCTRNLLRNEVFPILNSISQDAESGLVRLSDHAKETEEYLKTQDIAVECDGDKASIEIKDVHPYLMKRAIRRAFSDLQISKDIEERHVNIILDFLGAKNGDTLDMPFGVKVAKEYNKLVFYKAKKCEDFCVPFSVGHLSINGEMYNVVRANRQDIGRGKLIFDISKIPADAHFRHRECEDVFTKFGGGTKSLGDYLTDKKVPKRIRDDMILLADGRQILMILGVEISDKIKITNDTKDEDIFCITKED